ncbi:nucleotide-sugar epimerase [Maribacter phage Colly_1]|uniref:Nucleotide-sugar epimerase n=1 Tax=Maribacter phage Colly_1 TaxID=2745691 RepID=A0A8E4UY31_9CAUD|nr:nucleotide-sugar epimerase [Maribacter phage Colly_1]QQO97330.1 nucleotide-sugar epimerase [Maribacter phage Colly_1]
MSKVAVTGGAGFIGGEFVQQLNADPEVSEIKIIDISFPDYKLEPKMKYYYGNVSDLARLINLFKGVDEVYDNVGLLGTHDTEELGAYPFSAAQVNNIGFLNQIQAAEMCGIKKFFHQTKDLFFNEYENTYTFTKKAAELYAFWARYTGRLNVTVATYFNASGYRQHLGPIRKLFPLVTVQALLGLDLTIYGTGNQTLDAVHPTDLVRAAILLTKHDDGNKEVNKIYDIGTGQRISVNELCDKIIEFSGSDSKKVYLPMRQGEKADAVLEANVDDVRMLEEKYGFKCEKSTDEIITEYIEYYRTQVDPVYVYNCLKYFQDTYGKFKKDGVEVDIADYSILDIKRLLRGF